MTGKIAVCLGLMMVLGINGCASTGLNHEEQSKNNLTSLETYNRSMFEINRKIDKYVIRPTAKGYKKITNKTVRRGVTNFFNNITEPISAVNYVLQGEFASSGNNLGRFVVNTTFGMVGLFDVATSIGLKNDKTGFDETLSIWCVPDGPYVVLPIIGPSTPRAFAGFVGDSYTSPLYLASEESSDSDADAIYYGLSGLKYLNLMAENMGLLESLEEGSIDYYETMKSTYLQNRRKLKKCRYDTEEVEEYDFDMDMDD